MMIKYLMILLLCCTKAAAQSNTDLLNQWTAEHEAKLLKKYSIIKSTEFETECLLLAKKLAFTQLNSCQLFDSAIINAYVFNNGHVYFSRGMMQLINNKPQWAAILAHENAHIFLQHYLKTLKYLKKPAVFFPKSKLKKMLKKHEKEADEWSQKRLTKFHMDYSQIYYFLRRVAEKKKQGNNSHLKLSKRIKLTKNTELIDKTLIHNIMAIINTQITE